MQTKILSPDPKPTKSVSFEPGTYSPPPAECCPICKYRNITPKIRDMHICLDCYNRVCEECFTTMSICKLCYEELFFEPLF